MAKDITRSDSSQASSDFTTAPQELVALSTPTGVLVWVARTAYEAMLAAGGAELSVRIGNPSADWISQSQAGRMYAEQQFNLDEQTARHRVRRAMQRGWIVSSHGRLRLDSFKAWMLDHMADED